jgi:ribosomal protein S18 acetylase RimI-like enzyme
MPEIRSAVSSDVSAVLAFWEVATAEPSTTDDAGSLRQLLDFAPDALLLATNDDEIIGTVVVGWDGWRGTLYRLAVAPERRREGIAAMLVDEAETQLRASGAQRLHLIVAGGQPVAEAFWTSAGYTRTDQHRFVKTFTAE